MRFILNFAAALTLAALANHATATSAAQQSIPSLSSQTSAHVEVAKKGSKRVGGRNSKGKGSHYVGGRKSK